MLDLIDIGANLASKPFEPDRAEVVARAIDAGVRRMIVTGTSVADSRRAADIAAAHPGVLWSTAGIHPHDAHSGGSSAIDDVRQLASNPRVVAIGECGLDFFRDLSPREVQLEWFEAQVALAAELEMPLFVHERDAATAVADVLRRHRDRIPRAVVHCFTGDRAALDAYLALDLHIGITGWICDERRGAHLAELVAAIPPDRLMIETDAPYLLPRTIQPWPKSRRNEPAFLVHVVEAIAAATGRSTAEVAAASTRTAEQFFGLA